MPDIQVQRRNVLLFPGQRWRQDPFPLMQYGEVMFRAADDVFDSAYHVYRPSSVPVWESKGGLIQAAAYR